MKTEFENVLNKIFKSVTTGGTEDCFLVNGFIQVRKAELMRKTLTGSKPYQGYCVEHMYDEYSTDYQGPSLEAAILTAVNLIADQIAKNLLDNYQSEKLAQFEKDT